MATKMRRSSGNVYRDLGFSPAEAESLRIRSELMVRVRKVIEDEDLTQAAAARLFAVSQPRVSDLVRGRIELFSIDTLVNMLAKAGLRATVTIRARTRANGSALGCRARRRRLTEAPKFQCQTLPKVEWNAMWPAQLQRRVRQHSSSADGRLRQDC